MKIDQITGKQAIYGGLLLGGGGGGSLPGGLEVLEQAMAYGGFELRNIADFSGSDIVVTASLVGSPASKEKYVGPEHYDRAYELLTTNLREPISGVITNEMGAQAVTNGWIVAAKQGLPFIDAPCNGRAHPTGAMGSMSLSSDPNYVTTQAAAGGRGERNISLCVSGTLKSTAKVISAASIEAGGFVTVLRNPINVDYVEKNGAIGAVAATIEIGKTMLENLDCPYKMTAAMAQFGLEIVGDGVIDEFLLETKNGLDLGYTRIKCSENIFEVSIWNEYLTLEDQNGRRIATFPDLIVIVDKQTVLPIISADLQEGTEVLLCKIPRGRLILGSSMGDRSAIADAEEVLEKKLL